MASAAIAAAEVAAEAVAEALAETAAETAAEAAAEAAAEGAAEAAAEGAAEAAAESAAEEAAESAAEEAAEAAAEQAAEEAAEEAASSSLVGKVVKIGVMVTVGLGIASIVDLIKSDTGAGKKKCTLDQDTQHKLDLVLDALNCITGVISRWNEALKSLPQDTDLGNIQVEVRGSKKDVSVSALFWEMFGGVQKDFKQAQSISNSCSENCEWKANLQVFTLKIVNAISAMLAICNLRKQSSALQQHNIPAVQDEGTIQGILDKDFPDWKQFIEQQAKKQLNKMAIKSASSAATNAVLPIVKSPIQTETMSRVKTEVMPGIVNNAKNAGKRAANKVFDDRRGHITAISLIPFYGWVKAVQLISDASSDAKRDARNAANASAQAAFASPQVRAQVNAITQQVSEKVFEQHRSQVDSAMKNAVSAVLKKYGI